MEEAKEIQGATESRAGLAVLLAAIALFFAMIVYFSAGTYFATDDFIFLERIMDVRLGDALNPFRPIDEFFRPLSRDLYFRIAYRLFGFFPPGFHGINALLTGLNLVLFYHIGKRLTRGREASLWALLFFVAAPFNFRIYYWVSCVQDVMMTTLACAAALCFLARIKSEDGSAPRRWIAAALGPLFFGLSLLAKESALWLPAWLWIYHLKSRSRDGTGLLDAIKSVWKTHLAYDAVLALYVAYRIIWLPAPSNEDYAASVFGLHPVHNLDNYVHDVFMAVGVPGTARGAHDFIHALAFIIGLAGLSSWLYYKRRSFPQEALLGLAWFGLGVLVFLPLKGRSYPYYVSFASMGFFWTAGYLAAAARARLAKTPALFALVAYAALILGQGIYRDREQRENEYIAAAARHARIMHQEMRKLRPSIKPGSRIIMSSDLRLGKNPALYGVRALYGDPRIRVYSDEQAFIVEERENEIRFLVRDDFNYTGAMFFSYAMDGGLTESRISPDGTMFFPVFRDGDKSGGNEK